MDSHSLIINIVLIVFLVILITFSAFFSAAETAYTSTDPIKLENSLPKNSAVRKTLKRQFNFFERILSTILIGNNIVNILASTLISYLLSKLIAQNLESLNIIVSTLVLTPIIVIFGEIIPKVLVKKNPLAYLKKVAYVIHFLYLLFFPFTYLISKFLTKGSIVSNTEQDIVSHLKRGYNEGVLDRFESKLAINALNLDSKFVKQHYIRIKDVDFVNYNDDLRVAKSVFLNTNYSRLPVKKDNQFIGVLMLKTIFEKDDNDKVEQHMIDVPKISVNSLLTKALYKMQLTKSHLLIVTKTKTTRLPIGIITLEDIIEELIGEVYDETDHDSNMIELALSEIIVFENAKIREINENMHFSLPEEYETIQKWIVAKTKRNLKVGLKFTYKDYVIEVVENKRNSLAKIKIKQK